MSPEVEVKFLLHFREWAGDSRAQLSAETIGELVSLIERRYSLEGKIRDGSRIRPWTRILLDGRDVTLLEGFDTRLSPADRIALVYPFMESG